MKTAWRWFKKFWWVVAIGFVLLLCCLFDWTLVSRQSWWQGWKNEFNAAKKKAEVKAAKRERQRVEAAQRTHQARIAQIKADKQRVLAKLTEDQQRRLKEYENDPEKLIAWLDDLDRSPDP